MALNSQNDEYEYTRKIMEGHLRECFGRVVYSHKTHEKCTDLLHERLANIKIWQIVLSALTSAGFVGAVLGDHKEASAIVGLILSTILLVLNSYMKNYDLGELAQKHKQAANDLWIIREKYLSLLVDLVMNKTPIEELTSQRDALLKELHSVYVGAPSTNFDAYKKAQKALQKWEDLTFKDGEIDAFLPSELKRQKS